MLAAWPEPGQPTFAQAITRHASGEREQKRCNRFSLRNFNGFTSPNQKKDQ